MSASGKHFVDAQTPSELEYFGASFQQCNVSNDRMLLSRT
jgi:hypothetical protein